ncbi:hypothetical protein EZV62_014549 [Acer yangbiense]|uniref:Hflx-type G domain-containing protein n=1 Tax=Acer yangbiense TaxID=1000413 RepID=A0A5C7HUN4_9ROSI|nr:hypothetical protein EZV62_014549 [Acer yangbiense]
MFRSISLTRTHFSSCTKTLTFPFHILSSPYSVSSEHQQINDDNDGSYIAIPLFNRDPTDPPRLFLVQPRLKPPTFMQAKLNEALCLANSLEEQRDGYFDTDFFEKELPPHVVVQNPSRKSAKTRAGSCGSGISLNVISFMCLDTYFGPGTVEAIKCHLNNAEAKARNYFAFYVSPWGEVDAIFVNAILSGIQQRNLEATWEKPVLDRVGLIIEIFNAHAHSKEAMLQAELAALMYKKSRLVRVRGPDGRSTFGAAGEAEVVSARGRGSGGRGFISGAGETELQLQRRRIIERRRQLLSQIEEVRRTRALQRAARKRHGGVDGQGLVTVAVVGYTNAGKSTLVSALSKSDLYRDARLFATLDPRLKSVVLPSGRKVLLSDTVGFISDLPIQLVDAFRATLEEVVEADLLVHVLDCTAPNLDEHRSTVLQVLQQVGVSQEKVENMIEVWNKIDYHEEEMADDEYPSGGEISSFSGEEAGNLSAEEAHMASEVVDVQSCNKCGDNNAESNDNLYELSTADLGETIDENQGDSDGWLLSEDDQDNVYEYWTTVDDQQSKPTNDDRMIEKDAQSEDQHTPDVKISAITGVGLQELLEIIEDRLKAQDNKWKASNIVARDFYNQKWRPPRTEEDRIAAEQ